MSGIENNVDLLSQDLENQYLGAGPSHRRDSESSGSSRVSSVAGSRRRHSTRPRGSQNRGSGRTMSRVYPKVRTGCDTCKRRKIKCGEEKPVCENCIKSKRHCEGYHPPQPNIFDPSTSTSTPASLDPSTERLCQYFRTKTAPRLASYQALQLNLYFWQTVVPRMADGCPPIRHAMLALAAMQEIDEAEGFSQRSNQEERDQAWEQYGLALNEFRPATLPPSEDEILVCCLLLTLCHLWNFDLLNCFQHIMPVLYICISVKRTSPSRSPLPNSTDVYRQMLVPAFQYFSDCAFIFMNDMDEPQLALINELAQRMDVLMPATFMQADEAYATIDQMIRQIAKLDATTPAIRLTEMSGYLASLRLTLEQTLALAYTGDISFVADLRMLRVHERAAFILLSGLAGGNEMVYDQHLVDFEFIVSEIQDLLQPNVNVGRPELCTKGVWMGILPPLFLAATKCRDRVLRQHAIDLMHIAPHEEYIWTSCVARQIAMEVVRFEDMHNLFFDTGSFPGDGSRVALRGVYFNTFENKIELDLGTQTAGGPSLQKSAIHWEPKIEPDPVQPYHMPHRIVRACGYSTLMISFRSSECRCGARRSPTNSDHLVPTTSN